MAEKIRIQKLLASWGVASRRAIEKMIGQGRIKVGGQVLTEQGFKIDPTDTPQIMLDNHLIKKPASTGNNLYIFHKPVGIVATLKDEKKRKSIKDFLPENKRLYPVGRLDMYSSGLLLITDNGELTNRLLHPSFKVEKEYVVRIEGSSLSRQEKADFRQGIELEEGTTAPCKLIQHKDTLLFTVVLKEGRKRQIRRMFEKLGRKVVKLHRIRFGPLKLGNLKPGELRRLGQKDKSALLKAAGLK
jgi:pseudouridine synthase